MGGWAPLGYEVKDRKLVVNEKDARLVRSIFQRFLKTGSATILAQQLIREGVRNKYGKLIDKGILYKLLNNRVYIGEAVHKGVSYPGEHVAIIDRKVWDKVQGQFQSNPRKRSGIARSQTPSLLKGLIFGSRRCRHVPFPHPQKRSALPLLREPDDLKAGNGGLPDRTRSGRRDQEDRDRPGSHPHSDP
jgi:hypothetical protein